MDLVAYIINLKHRKDRYNHVLNEIKKIPLKNFTIVEGVIDKTCFKSHRKCIELAKLNNLPYVLILEDDVIFIEKSKEILIKSFEELNSSIKWDMFFLGANLQSKANRISDNILKLNNSFAAHAYIVNQNFYNTILNLPPNKEMDVHYNNLMSTNNIYSCDPLIAFQLPSYSDLQPGFKDYNQALINNYLKYKP